MSLREAIAGRLEDGTDLDVYHETDFLASLKGDNHRQVLTDIARHHGVTLHSRAADGLLLSYGVRLYPGQIIYPKKGDKIDLLLPDSLSVAEMRAHIQWHVERGWRVRAPSIELDPSGDPNYEAWDFNTWSGTAASILAFLIDEVGLRAREPFSGAEAKKLTEEWLQSRGVKPKPGRDRVTIGNVASGMRHVGLSAMLDRREGWHHLLPLAYLFRSGLATVPRRWALHNKKRVWTSTHVADFNSARPFDFDDKVANAV